jgi:hypothetical protein
MPEVAAAYKRIQELGRRLAICVASCGYFGRRLRADADRIVDAELHASHDRTCHGEGNLSFQQWIGRDVRPSDDSFDQRLADDSQSHGGPSVSVDLLPEVDRAGH